MKRCIAVLICALFVLPLMISPVFAIEYGGRFYDYHLHQEIDAEWCINDETGVCTISGTAYIPNYDSGGYAPYCGTVNGRFLGPLILHFVVSEGITRVGNYALRTAGISDRTSTNVKDVSIASTVTSIGEWSLFQPSIEKVVIYSENATIEEGAIHPNSTIYCYANSTAHIYAVENSRNFVLMCKEHTAVLQNAVEPDCVGNGYSGDEICTVCGMTVAVGEVVPALGHNPVISGKIDASCEDSGYSGDVVCERCGVVLGVGEEISPLGHSFSAWIPLTNPTCTETGSAYRICDRCTVTEYTAIPQLGHHYAETVYEPTEVEEGYTIHTCSICGDTYKDSIVPVIPCPSKAFTDNPFGTWYHLPVDWAVANGITTGATATTFNPNGNCLRAQIVTFMWRAVGSPEPEIVDNPFVDVKESDFYYKPVLWAYEQGVTAGMDATHFGPLENCNRAQVVTFLWRMEGKPGSSGTNPFEDVPAGAFYEDAVTWAVEQNITNGVDSKSFGAMAICNRAQIVTFLYRDIVR